MTRILYVCMGNICRSPTAKGVFDATLRERGIAFESASAGTHEYHVGRRPDARAIRAASAVGIDIADDIARQVAENDFHAFDRIFVMDRANFEVLARIRPADARAEVRLIMELVPEYGLDEVPDPYYGGDDGFVRVIDMLQAAALALAEELASAAGRERGTTPE
ncbi:low molecular weight phosphotyrosine protein phosphatase [Wenzhouxiangella sp. XN79A]|uniref:low molecular weight protein-tyrosine-phosphatase n=1 Tax=Wenzhouxiangella sp. XN79A TaxID=2724193 RepID=UPI00144A82CB|nr:low molecular weight protein-tyrosine-phosphatase [Wenzhouxiangella sp. XN79A]NKI35479.1 low molecular weight phosphotyrosine protein phosphatase [Wenzhouxiangella sp. XN79A]